MNSWNILMVIQLMQVFQKQRYVMCPKVKHLILIVILVYKTFPSLQESLLASCHLYQTIGIAFHFFKVKKYGYRYSKRAHGIH
jgi:hypothetical protein